MKTRWILPVLAAFTVVLSVQAQVYKWKDAQGNTIISDTPQPGSGKMFAKPSANAQNAPDAAKEAPKSLADQDMEFKQRQQAQQKAEEEAEQAKAEADRKAENCQRARRGLAALESGQRIRQPQDDGSSAYMDDQQRQRETERMREEVNRSCQ
ncbi:MAG: DUF4124 domain-containing protein [Zoogloeaceae bacterium]|jgi:hypothetical protein|nr:DUF4124 domain-containing protein [Zoogloeaceae bacterium]